jgi:hypothetical protein
VAGTIGDLKQHLGYVALQEPRVCDVVETGVLFRVGLSPKAVARIGEVGAPKIVYVSCNPATLAPNVAQLQGYGYRLEHVTPVDMFPHTPHVECVALLTRADDWAPELAPRTGELPVPEVE